jgi:L-fuculose-phosphate aldolase
MEVVMQKLQSEDIAGLLRETIERCLAMRHAQEPAAGSDDLFHAPETAALKEEIVHAGRKLWERQYVDGNGGNISVRLPGGPHDSGDGSSGDRILCTPTMMSKGDLRADELCLVDLDNRLLCGCRPQTSEILLHLEIYKAVPEAKAVIHCHPPYATAHALAGIVPPGNLLSEQEIFIGPVALAPYETPGTPAFAATVLPYVRNHNTILLAHHGIVCWADTVTHAEWYTEVIETYCKTVMIARQLQPRLEEIPAAKIQELLNLKQRWGLPDARLPALHQDAQFRSPAAHSNGHGAGERNGRHTPSRNGHNPGHRAAVEALVAEFSERILRLSEE